MTLKTPVSVALLFAALTFGSSAWADDRGEHHEAPHQQAPAAHARPVRQAPPKFQAHPPGAHPRGVTVPQHQVRVLAPVRVTRRGQRTWTHWDHPEFSRPTYYWNWGSIHTVSCIAEDTYGDQYPVTENVWRGFGLNDMTGVEDDSLDRCYSESGQDSTCVLATCSSF